MRDLNYQLKQLCRRNRDGGYATQRNRERLLSLIADQLRALGFRNMNAQSLKPKHVEGLVNRWQEESLSVGTIKNTVQAIMEKLEVSDRTQAAVLAVRAGILSTDPGGSGAA